METPTNFSDPALGHVKEDILGMLTGPLADVRISPDSALNRIRQHCSAEFGYSDELVKSLPAWIKRFDTPVVEESPVEAPEEVTEEPEVEPEEVEEPIQVQNPKFQEKR